MSNAKTHSTMLQVVRIALYLGLAAVPTLGAAQDKVTLRMGTFVNKLDIRYSGLQHFAELVSKKTDGRVTVQIFDSGSLHPFDKPIDSILGGVSDISPLAAAGIDKRLPCALQTQFLPLAVDWSRIVDLDLEYNEILNEEYGKIGLRIILSQDASYDQEWWFRGPPMKLDELNGKLVRSVGPVITHVIQRFGGKAVFISPTETYQSAERGVVDVINMGVSTFSSWKLWAVMPNMVRANMFYSNVAYAINKAKFDKLRAEDQKALLEAGVEAARWTTPRYEAWIDQQIGGAIMRGGASVTNIPKAERLRLINKAAEGWNDQIDKACGPAMGQRIRAVFKKYEG